MIAPKIAAVVRCWPNGRVVPSVVRLFSAPPVVGDVIEFADVEVAVVGRRFDPNGGLHLRCETPNTAEEVAAAFDAAVENGQARR